MMIMMIKKNHQKIQFEEDHGLLSFRHHYLDADIDWVNQQDHNQETWLVLVSFEAWLAEIVTITKG